MDDIPRNKLYRALEILPGALSWLILLGPALVAFWFPRGVAVFITMYVLLWFLRSLKTNAFLIHGYIKDRAYEKLNWNHLLKFFSDDPPVARTSMEKTTAEEIEALKRQGRYKPADALYHVVIIATYKEELDILEPTIESLTQVEYPLDRIILVLATEERDRARAEANVAHVEKRFGKTFGQLHHFMHPANVPDEMPAKGANINFAGRAIARIFKNQGIDFNNVLVTTLDADNRPHPKYFANLSYHYLMEPNRERRSYQPLPFFYSNIWDVPFVNRLVAIANTFWYMGESGEAHHLRNAAAHAQGLDTLVAMDFWSAQTIVEDCHQFWRTFFHFNGDHEVVPLYIPVYQDALQNRTYFTSLVGQYKQLRRWAWGASDVPFAFIKAWKQRRTLPVWRTLEALSYLIYAQIMWATAPIILLLNQSIPEVLNPKFSTSLFAYNLHQVLGVVYTVMSVGIILSLFISLISLPRPKGRFSRIHFTLALFQWILLPFVTIFYGSIPAIDAQTRLMFNKPLGFAVTEKIRKIN